MFVESSLPPSPTSITAKSTFLILKYSNAIIVFISKNEKSFCLKNMWLLFMKFFINDLSIFFPLTWILSLKSYTWGEVNNPIFKLRDKQKLAIDVETDPLPFVPPTWMDLKALWGLLKCLDKVIILVNPGLIAVWPDFW